MYLKYFKQKNKVKLKEDLKGNYCFINLLEKCW